MVRQDHLESLADPEVSVEAIWEHRAVANFIREFLTEIKPNLEGQIEDIKREQAGLKPAHLIEGDPWMETSEDPNDPDLTTVNQFN